MDTFLLHIYIYIFF